PPRAALPALRGDAPAAHLLRHVRGGHHTAARVPAAPAASRLRGAPARWALPGLRRAVPCAALLHDLRGRHHAVAPLPRRPADLRSPRRPGPRVPVDEAAALRGLRRAAAGAGVLRAVRSRHHAAACLPAEGRAARLPAAPDDAAPLLALRGGDARPAPLCALRGGYHAGAPVRGV